MLLAVPIAFAAPCPAPATLAELSATTFRAETAFATMDLPIFRATATEVQALAPCLAERLAPADAAGFHRVNAYAAFADQNAEGAVVSFRAVVAAQPGWEPPASLAPTGHPLRTRFEEAKAAKSGVPVPVEHPTATTLVVDGTPSEYRDIEHPSIIQLLATDGKLLRTDVVPAGNWPLDYTAFETQTVAIVTPNMGTAASVVVPANAATTIIAPRKPPVALFIASGAAALASVGLYATAVASRDSFDDEATEPESLDGLRTQTNGLVVGAGIFGAAALGLGATAVITLAW